MTARLQLVGLYYRVVDDSPARQLPMNPVRRALNKWKRDNEGGTVQEFAEAIGYAQADTVYRLLRNEFIPPVERLQKISDISGEPLGSVSTYFIKNATKKARKTA